jgi:hypothetical protein
MSGEAATELQAGDASRIVENERIRLMTGVAIGSGREVGIGLGPGPKASAAGSFVKPIQLTSMSLLLSSMACFEDATGEVGFETALECGAQ